MEIKKQYLKSKAICKVTFRLPKAAAPAADNVHLVGDFNKWDPRATPMMALKSGDYTIKLNLDTGRDYEFRYLIDGSHWENDWHADQYRPAVIPGVENSVVVV